MKILKSLKPHEEITIAGHPYDQFQRIKNFPTILHHAKKGEQILVTLNIPDTWCNTAGDGAWFAIKANNVVVARGLYSCARDLQRIPIALQAVIEVDHDQSIEIEATWANFDKMGSCHIGMLGDSVLTAIVNDETSMDRIMDSKMEEFFKKMPDMPGFPKGFPGDWK